MELLPRQLDGYAVKFEPGMLRDLENELWVIDFVVKRLARDGWQIVMDPHTIYFDHAEVTNFDEAEERLSGLGIDPRVLSICGPGDPLDIDFDDLQELFEED
jgi:hypothetical protein